MAAQSAPGGGFRGGRGFGGRAGGLQAAATYLGISTTDLFTDIRSGKSLAQIANSTSGKSASGLIDAMVAAQEQQISAAVKSGRLTQAQADQLTANVKSRVTAMVNGTGFGGPPGGGNGFGFGQGGGGGGQAPSQGSSPSQPGQRLEAGSARATVPARADPLRSAARSPRAGQAAHRREADSVRPSRKAEMARYAEEHYGIDSWKLVHPRVIVEHYTATTTFSSAWNTFANDTPDPELHELPGDCAHFIIDTDGTTTSSFRSPSCAGTRSA